MQNFAPIRLKRIELCNFDYRLSSALLIGSGAFDLDEGFLVRLFDEKGNVGLGEGTPCKETGDKKSVAIEEAKRLYSLICQDFNSVQEFFSKVVSQLKSNTLRNAMDCAFHDLLARGRGIPAYKLYTDRPRAIQNSFTVCAFEDPQATEAEVRDVLTRFPHLKLLKLKLLGSDDVRRCEAVKKVTPEYMKFAVDVNQGYRDPETAAVQLSRVAQVLGNVAYVEEPCIKGDLESLKYVHDKLNPILVAADESCVNMDQLHQIIERKAASAINIKLQKIGGITAALAMSKLAAENRMRVLIGCMLEIPQALSAAMTFAVVDQNVMYTDLDSDFYIKDLETGMMPFQDGQRQLIEAPGFGPHLDQKELNRAIQRGNLDMSPILELNF